MQTFESLGLSEATLKVLKKKGFEEPTPIQIKTIPALLQGERDMIGQAQTGTGKTAAFGLPILELIQKKSHYVKALVLVPTRELAIQVAEELYSLKGKKALNILPVYGGQSIQLQLRSLRKGVDIVVGTPGRIMDHLKRGTLKLDYIEFMVLDEADEMLNMGFLEDVQTIMEATAKDKRTLLFSATMPSAILKIAKNYMREYDIFKVTKDQLTITKTDQIYFEVSESNKFEALCRIIDIEEEFYGLIFCRTKVDVDRVAHHLMERGYDADMLHGDISQNMRERILGRFKNKTLNVLVATDVAARGIDVKNITHVINYALPNDSESYVHRIGRTGRAGKEGVAITFMTPKESSRLRVIQKVTKSDIRKAAVPKVADVLGAKRRRVQAMIEEVIEQDIKDDYAVMANELLGTHKPARALAALLQYAFGDELDESQYSTINEGGVDHKGRTRLFVRQGKKDGLTPQRLINIIKEHSKIKGEKIRDIQIFDTFSFISLPFKEAEVILALFKVRRKGSNMYITKAKDR